MKYIGIKKIKTVLANTLLAGILFFVGIMLASSQEIVPFEAKQPEVFDSATPSSFNKEVATFNGSGPNRAAPPGGGNGLGITPVRDAFWLFPLLAILYGAITTINRRREENKSNWFFRKRNKNENQKMNITWQR